MPLSTTNMITSTKESSRVTSNINLQGNKFSARSKSVLYNGNHDESVLIIENSQNDGDSKRSYLVN